MSSLPMVQAAVADLAAAIVGNKVNTQGPTGGIGGFLKFDFESGSYSYGRDGDDVTDDSILINTRTISHGWTLWADGKVQKSYAPFTQDLPAPMLPVAGKQPSESRAFQGNFWDEGAPGPALTFETNSYGGRQAVNRLIEQIAAQAVKDPVHLFPLVKLKSEFYVAKAYGRVIHNPVFEIVGWADADGKLKGAIAAPAQAAMIAAPEAPAPAEPARRRRVQL